jgi:hypothetical protein
VRPTAGDVRDAYRARQVLEGASLAALLADPERRAPQVESALTDLAAAVAGGAALRDAVAADMRLHLALVALAGSDRLVRAARGVAFDSGSCWPSPTGRPVGPRMPSPSMNGWSISCGALRPGEPGLRCGSTSMRRRRSFAPASSEVTGAGYPTSLTRLTPKIFVAAVA